MLTTEFQINKMIESKKRRTEIKIETHSLTIIKTRSGEPSNPAYYRNCDKNTAVFRQAHAVLIFHAAFAKLEQLLQNNQIHFAENGDLCGNSLAAFFSKEIRYVED